MPYAVHMDESGISQKFRVQINSADVIKQIVIEEGGARL
jgi:hypothetical protein